MAATNLSPLPNEPCHRCGGQPVAEKVRSFWRAMCPSHQGLSSSVSGHTMKTRKESLAAWDAAMLAYKASAAKNAVALVAHASDSRIPKPKLAP